MNRSLVSWRSPRILLCVLFAGLLGACSGTSQSERSVRVWIDVPIDGFQAAVGEPVHIEGHAAYHAGVTRVEVWVNEELHLVEESPPPEGDLARFDQMWTPPGIGEYTIQAVAIATDGTASAPDQVQIQVVEQLAEVTPSPAPTAAPTTTPTAVAPTLTPTSPPEPPTLTPSPPPAPVISFWADAEQVAAGTCTTLHWQTQNVQAVRFNGNSVAADGSHQTCPCNPETHTLSVVLADGSQTERQIAISVTGSCVTPTSTTPPDTSAPPAPVLLKPFDEESFDCVPSLMLWWEAVSDPSGIAVYRVQVERHAGDNNWQAVEDSPWRGITAPELELEVECGWIYRWRVRAVDGAANVGPFSEWRTFTIPLG
ncbi:MAG: hypothetical protein PVI59_07345 [Anaerolineae bacterium]|jgi:hypothetical protein